RPRRCHAPAAWKSADSSARRQQRRAGAIAASSSRMASETDTLEREHAPLVVDAEVPERPDPVHGDDAVTRDDDAEAVARAEGPRGAGRTRPARERGQLPVRDDLAARHA